MTFEGVILRHYFAISEPRSILQMMVSAHWEAPRAVLSELRRLVSGKNGVLLSLRQVTALIRCPLPLQAGVVAQGEVAVCCPTPVLADRRDLPFA